MKKKIEDLNLLKENIGKIVIKKSGCPFKSTFKKNTVKEVVKHPILNDRYAYTFIEDDSFVECFKCESIN